MSKMLLKSAALSLALTTMPVFSAPAAAQEAPPAKHEIIEYCKVVAENSGIGPRGFGGCVGFWNSYPNALPTQTCKFYRGIGLITQEQFPDCIAYFKDLEQ